MVLLERHYYVSALLGAFGTWGASVIGEGTQQGLAMHDPREGAQQANVAYAASPEAIATPGPHKLPLSNNDPTRDITPGEVVARSITLLLAVLTLVVLAVATTMVFLERT
jgi:hypothetical protein